jgi:hypothetical protein
MDRPRCGVTRIEDKVRKRPLPGRGYPNNLAPSRFPASSPLAPTAQAKSIERRFGIY